MHLTCIKRKETTQYIVGGKLGDAVFIRKLIFCYYLALIPI
jgi:hypothetical protein